MGKGSKKKLKWKSLDLDPTNNKQDSTSTKAQAISKIHS